MKLKVIEEKYGVDFGAPSGTELRDYLAGKGWVNLAKLLTPNDKPCSKQ